MVDYKEVMNQMDGTLVLMLPISKKDFLLIASLYSGHHGRQTELQMSLLSLHLLLENVFLMMNLIFLLFLLLLLKAGLLIWPMLCSPLLDFLLAPFFGV